MNKNRGTQLAHGAICTALTVVLMLLARYLPVFSVVSVLLTGLPVIFLGTRYGGRLSGISLIASVLVLALVMGDFLSAILLGVLNLLPGFAIGYAFSHRKGYRGAVILGSGMVLLGLLVQLMVVNLLSNGNGLAELVNETMAGVEMVLNQAFSGMEGANQQEMLASVTGLLQTAKERFFLYLPTMLIALSAMIGYATVSVGIFMLKRLHIKRISYRKFSEIIAPRSACFLSVILSMLVLFVGEGSVFAAGILNLSMLLELFLAVCGLSLVDAKLSEKISSGYGRAGIYLGISVVAYVLLGMLLQVLSLLGMIDGLFGFRWYKVGENHGKED